MIKKTFTSCILLKSEIENTSLRAYAKNVSSKELKLPSLFYKEFFFFPGYPLCYSEQKNVREERGPVF